MTRHFKFTCVDLMHLLTVTLLALLVAWLCYAREEIRHDGSTLGSVVENRAGLSG